MVCEMVEFEFNYLNEFYDIIINSYLEKSRQALLVLGECNWNLTI